MADQDNLRVEGYRFGTLQDAEMAQNELKKIAYFQERTKGRGVQTLLALYDKLLDEKVFQTPAGWEYLRELQTRLSKAGIPDEKVRPIPLYTNFSYKTGEELDSAFIRQRIRPKKVKKVNINALQISVVINILLVILVIVLFSIAMKSDHPNILNYRRAITNEYASWEEQLREREIKLREKELEYQMNLTEARPAEDTEYTE